MSAWLYICVACAVYVYTACVCKCPCPCPVEQIVTAALSCFLSFSFMVSLLTQIPLVFQQSVLCHTGAEDALNVQVVFSYINCAVSYNEHFRQWGNLHQSLSAHSWACRQNALCVCVCVCIGTCKRVWVCKFVSCVCVKGTASVFSWQSFSPLLFLAWSNKERISKFAQQWAHMKINKSMDAYTHRYTNRDTKIDSKSVH